MNAEMSKMRLAKNYGERIERTPTRIKENRLEEVIKTLNSSLSDKSNVDVNSYVGSLISNFYVILELFNEMGVYPDYFYDEYIKMRVEYKKILQNDDDRVSYRNENSIGVYLSARLSEAINNGLKNKYYRVQAYKKKDVNENFLELLAFFQAFNMSYNIDDKEKCDKMFKSIQYKQSYILEKLLNSDYLSDDIEHLSALLFEYMKFFVTMGIYPKQYLDDFIDSKSLGKTK